MRGLSILGAIAAMLAVIMAPTRVDACSRVVYLGDDSLVVVGRSLDWKTPIPTNLWVYPRGIVKRSHSADGAFEWTSRYGTVYAVSYDSGVTEGMNEKGLVVNSLFCKGTVYSDSAAVSRKPVSLAVFVAWILDNNATVTEALDMLRSTDFEISGSTFDGGTVAALHWGITDASGRSAVLEIDHGKLAVYEGDGTRVLTNDPAFPLMQAIEGYWRGVGGVNMLPGGVRSPDRYVRGTFFLNHVRRVADGPLGVAITRSIVENVSVPYSYTVEGEPNLSSTQWRTMADARDLRYYFDNVTASGMYYIDLRRLDLRRGAPVLKLDTSNAKDVAGEANSLLIPTAPFTPAY